MNNIYNILKSIIEKLNVAVKSVNGATPDDSGNVVVQAGTNPDWNQNDSAAADYVKNRPFYSVEGLHTVTWDGDKTDKVSVMDAYYKVSDLTPIAEEFVCYLKSGETEESVTISGSNVNTDYSGFCLVSDRAIICYDNSNPLMGQLYFPETGIYFSHTGSAYTSKLEFVAETVKTIDRKYIEKKFVVDATNLPSNTTEWGKLYEQLNAAYNAGDVIFLDVYGGGGTLLKLTNVYNNTVFLFMYAVNGSSISAYILSAYPSDGGSLTNISFSGT